MIRVFIDGGAGTTGLQIERRLSAMPEVDLIKLPEEARKEVSSRRDALNSADAAVLCLPDDAAREAVTLVENDSTVIFDASTAHRTAPGWAYGFPELSKAHLEAVRTSNRITVPGCHASGFCALVYPLVSRGMVSSSDVLSCFSLTGYSGGGKAMISEFEGENAPTGALPYALGHTHKHLPEMKAVCGLENAPVFMPVLATVRQGMIVSVPLGLDAHEVHKTLAEHYAGAENVEVTPFGGGDMLENGRLCMTALNGTDKMQLFVFGHERQTVISARFDNLGKGASGAACQCLKLRFNLK